MATACADYNARLENASGAYEACVRLRVPALRGVCKLTLDRLFGCGAILGTSRREAVLALKRTLRKKTPPDGCKGVELPCRLTRHNVRLLCEPDSCMFPTTTTSSTTTTTTIVTAPTTTTSTTTAPASAQATTGDDGGDACQQRCVNEVLKHCFEDCVDDCDGDACALQFCQRGCRDFNCDELSDRCTTEGGHAQDYVFCCKTAGDDACSQTVDCIPITTTTTKSTTTTTTLRTPVCPLPTDTFGDLCAACLERVCSNARGGCLLGDCGALKLCIEGACSAVCCQ
jgi:hypothetical protein